MIIKRIQRKRTKGWKMPKNTIYVGRGSKWGNPYKVGWCCKTPYEYKIVKNNEHACSLFESYAISYQSDKIINGLVQSMDILINGNSIKELSGKNLACWCRLDEKCHADIILKLANTA